MEREKIAIDGRTKDRCDEIFRPDLSLSWFEGGRTPGSSKSGPGDNETTAAAGLKTPETYLTS